MPRALIDHDSFLKLQPAAQDNLLRQALLLWLTGLELAGRDPDAWEAEAFTSAIELLAMQAPRTAYRDVERMLLPPSERPASEAPPSEERQGPAPQTTSILRIDISEAAPASSPPRETPDRSMLRRRLLQFNAIQLSLDRTDTQPDPVAHLRREVAATADGDEAGD
ncbi:MAG: hypothetical protein KG075_02720 [Alphaproteobacteria bacterium]|nr:hypothetical protein [Alphaproteobacteria bacterium]